MKSSPKRIVTSSHIHIDACPTLSTTHVVENGLRGCEPLPVTEVPDGVVTAWVPSRRAINMLKKGGHAISLMISDDGSLSMTVLPVELVKDQ